MRHADGGDLPDRLVAQQAAFDLDRGDVLLAADYDVLQPVADFDNPVGVNHRRIMSAASPIRPGRSRWKVSPSPDPAWGSIPPATGPDSQNLMLSACARGLASECCGYWPLGEAEASP